MKINNIEDVRKYIIDSLEKLSKNKIDLDEMSIIAKSAEAISSTIKLQLSYCAMRSESPDIKFLQDCNKSSQKLIS